MLLGHIKFNSQERYHFGSQEYFADKKMPKNILDGENTQKWVQVVDDMCNSLYSDRQFCEM